MKNLNHNELLVIQGGSDDNCNSDAYNNGHAVGEFIGDVVSDFIDFLEHTITLPIL